MYKRFLYQALTIFSPSFDRHLVKKFTSLNTLIILDIGFYKGSFSKSLITKVLRDNNNIKIKLHSFDPNIKIDLNNFKKFTNINKVAWEHRDFAIGDKFQKENFTILNAFPSSGSSIKNILEDSLWYRTRKFLIDPFGNNSNKTSNIEVTVETIDRLFRLDQHIDLIKIDVEGYSLEVLKGANEYLKSNSPILQLEILSKKENFVNKEQEIVQYLKSLDYKLINKKQHYTTHIFSDVKCVDYLFEK